MSKSQATLKAGSTEANPDAPMLELRDVSAGYGPFRALFNVSIAVRRGTVMALLGSNGAGKTTVARVASGLVVPTSGTVSIAGFNVTGERAYRFARMGVVHAPEGRSVFASLSVEENLTLAFRQALGRHGTQGALDKAYDVFPKLRDRRTQVAGTLSGGEQRMLSLARVMGHPPKLMIADELSLGLAPIIVDEVYETLGVIRDAGTTLLIVEQHVRHALALADEVVVLTKGSVNYAGPVSELGDLAERLLPGSGGADRPEGI